MARQSPYHIELSAETRKALEMRSPAGSIVC